MEGDDKEFINETLDDGAVKYDLEIFLSTDGKHTVHVKASDPASMKKAYEVAVKTYDQILAKYGTKQATQGTVKPEVQKATCETCGGDAEMKGGTSKKGKPFRGVFCKIDKDHVKWLKA